VATRQTTVDDIFKQINRLIPTVHALLERYARSAEEIDSNHLALQEQRELLREHFAENSRWASELSKRIDRLEQYVILSRFGNLTATLQIETITSQEHIGRSLTEDLVTQRELWSTYQKNINRVRERIAKFGETTASINEVEGYEMELVKIETRIERIRKALEVIESGKNP